MDAMTAFGTYLAAWLERQQTQLRPGTWGEYRDRMRRYVLPTLADVPLEALTRRTIEQLYAHLFLRGGQGGRPLSKRSVEYVHTVLHKALEDAVRDGLLITNPSHGAVLPKVDHTRADPAGERLATWDAAQLRAFLAATAEHRYANLFWLAAFTGLRRGELCGLRWCDIDLDRRVLQLRRALRMERRHVQLRPPKNSRVRSLYLDRRTCAVLGRERHVQQERAADLGPLWHNDWDLVFTADSGRPLVPGTVSNAFRQTVAALPLPHIRFHDLRHTHATLMLEAGVPVKVVSERLGHASARQTMDIYAHVLPAMDRDAAVRFAEHVFASADQTRGSSDAATLM